MKFDFSCHSMNSIIVFFKTAETPDIAQLVGLFNVLLGVLMVVFIACECGERVTGQFETLEDTLTKCNWYSYPIEMQRIYLIFLAHTQQTSNIQSYGSITCTRETFKMVFYVIDINSINFIY